MHAQDSPSQIREESIRLYSIRAERIRAFDRCKPRVLTFAGIVDESVVPRTKEPRVTIVTLNMNGWQNTIECLESVLRTDYPSFDLIIVDNASTDESVEKITEFLEEERSASSELLSTLPGRIRETRMVQYSREETDRIQPENLKTQYEDKRVRVVIIRNESNRGFAEGNNIAVRYALRSLSPDYLLLLNNDTVVHPSFLDELVRTAQSDTGIGLVQSKLLNYDDLTINNIGGVCDSFGFVAQRGKYEANDGRYDQLTNTGFFYTCAACLLVSKMLAQKLKEGLFDDELFAYHEDLDLSWDARLMGLKVVYCPTSICLHKEGKTSGGANQMTAYWSYRNRLRVLTKNYSKHNLILTLPVALTGPFLSLLVSYLRTRELPYVRSLVRGLVWNIRNLGDTLDKRKLIQSLRVVGDASIRNYMVRDPLTVAKRSSASSTHRRG